MIYTKFEGIPWGRYDFIMADPPWLFKNRSAKGEKKNPVSQYRCMTIDQISNLQIGMYAAKDCCLWLWATNPMLDIQIDVLKKWGFTFKTSGHWAKMTEKSFERNSNVVSGKQHFGTGYCLRGAGEPFLIGTIGKPKFAKNIRSVLIAAARENSRKPDFAYQQAEKLTPHAEIRLDLFSRQARPGWDSFGDEVGKF